MRATDLKRQRLAQMDESEGLGGLEARVAPRGSVNAVSSPRRRKKGYSSRRRRQVDLMQSVMGKVQQHTAYGAGIPAQGIVPAAQLQQMGLNLQPNDQGLPPVGLNAQAFDKALTKQERLLVQSLLQRVNG